MKKLPILIVLFAAWTASSQPALIDRYEYWFNYEDQTKVAVIIPAEEQAELQLSLNTAEIPYGLNTISLRFRDTENFWSVPLTRFFIKVPPAETEGVERMISGYEYWFNGGDANWVSLVPSGSVNIHEIITASDLHTGLNIFSVRFRDNTGIWSSVLSRFFIKQPLAVDEGEGATIAGYEYWFNDGEANWASLAPSGNVNIHEIINASGLHSGLNIFSVRFRDNAGIWSSVLSRFFLKQPVVADEGEGPAIAGYQIWFNDDYEHAIIGSVESGETYSLLETLTVADLSVGLNKVNVRFNDQSGYWSGVLSKFFVKLPVQETAEPNLMTAYEYWLEDAEGNLFDTNGQEGRVLITLDEPINPYLLELDLDLRKISSGNYSLNFRFLDLKGSWSSVLSNEIEKTLHPYAVFGADIHSLCGSGTVHFSNFSIDADQYHWDFGDGNTSTEEEPSHTYETPGTYTVSLTAICSENGDEHSISEVDFIVVHPLPDPEVIADGELNLCVGDEIGLSSSLEGVFLWSTGATTPDITVTESGEYWVEVTDDNGCTGRSEPLNVVFHPLPITFFTYEISNYLVSFFNTSEGASNFYWDFGDGNHSTEMNPEHQYNSTGDFEACLTATSEEGCENTYCQLLSITVGINQTESFSQEKVYPIPFKDYLNISLPEGHEWQTIEVVNVRGGVISRKEVSPGQSLVSISTTEWDSGLYLIVLTSRKADQVTLRAIKK